MTGSEKGSMGKYDNVKTSRDCYSQNDEEKFILEFFKDSPGRFLDVGAFDGINLSNTRKLLESGRWSGVMVEPAPQNFITLIQNCQPFADKVVLVQAAVCREVGLKRFWIDMTPDREWSTTVNPALAESGSVLQPIPMDIKVIACTMADLEPFGPYDFINIDAEWEDMDIFRSMPELMVRRCQLLCIEPSCMKREEAIAELAKRGLKVVHETPENLLAAQQ